MNSKYLFESVKRIHKHLNDIEREYRKKNIVHRIREDWGHAFYTGKLVAYLYILNAEKYPFHFNKDLENRIVGLGINL